MKFNQVFLNNDTKNNEKVYKPGLLICKFSNENEFNITWPGGQVKQKLIPYIDSLIRKHGKFDNNEFLEMEVRKKRFLLIYLLIFKFGQQVSYVCDENIVNWKSVTLDELLEGSSINIIRISKAGDEKINNIEESPSRILRLKNLKKNSMNQVRYLQIMNEQKERPNQYKKITLEELRSHRNADDCWISYKGKVYDITNYLNYHPGGKDILLQFAGMDVTNACDHFHRWVNCERILQNSCVGFLEK